MRAGVSVLVCISCIAAWGCPPTLSRPRSDAFLDHLAQGERHARHGRHVAGAREFALASEAADRRVDRDEAAYRQARSLRRAGRWAEALVVFDRIAAAEPHSRRTTRALYDASRLRLDRTGDEQVGVRGLERVVREHPDDGPAARALVLLLAHDERSGTDVALRRVESLATLASTDLGDDLLAHEARLRLDNEDRPGARRALERLVARYPYPQGHRWDDAILRLAEMDVEDGRPAEAVRRLRAMLERAEGTTLVGSYTLPAFPEAQLRIARIQRDAGEFSEAESAFEAVYDDFPDSRLRDDALVELGEMDLDRGRRERGCRMLRKAVEEFEVGRARRRAARRIESDCPAQ